jgi:hypothetical protein
MNSYRREIEEIRWPIGFWVNRNAGYAEQADYCSGYVPLFNDPSVYSIMPSGIYLDIDQATRTAVENLASTRTRLKVGRQKAGWGETLVQYNKTIDLFATNAIRIYRAMSSLKKGDIAGAWTALQVSARRRQGLRFQKSYAKSPSAAVGGMWLELQYGWMPLVKDIYGTVELLHEDLSSKDFLERATASASRTLDKTWHPENRLGTTVSSSSVYAIKYIVYYRVIDRETRTLQQLGIINPVEVAWNILPFSFLVDWLLPIGNYLQSITATAGLQFDRGVKCIKIAQTSTRTDHGEDLAGPPISRRTYRFNYTGSRRKIEFRREVLTDFPPVSLPSFKNPFSRDHLLNAVALLSTFKRK